MPSRRLRGEAEGRGGIDQRRRDEEQPRRAQQRQDLDAGNPDQVEDREAGCIGNHGGRAGAQEGVEGGEDTVAARSLVRQFLEVATRELHTVRKHRGEHEER